jgi:hypothetical protein
MREIFLSAPFFLALFGALFLATGGVRLFRAGTEAKPAQAILWGSIGVVIGCVLIGAAVWFFKDLGRPVKRTSDEATSFLIPAAPRHPFQG